MRVIDVFPLYLFTRHPVCHTIFPVRKRNPATLGVRFDSLHMITLNACVHVDSVKNSVKKRFRALEESDRVIMPAESVPSAAVIARLLEEGIWCANEDMDAASSVVRSADAQWLQENVYPTLVPAIARMLELAIADMAKRGTTEVHAPAAMLERQKDCPDYGPTGRAHPITWLAEYLMRNSPQHGSTFLAQHPYVLVEQGKKAEATEGQNK